MRTRGWETQARKIKRQFKSNFSCFANFYRLAIYLVVSRTFFPIRSVNLKQTSYTNEVKVPEGNMDRHGDKILG